MQNPFRRRKALEASPAVVEAARDRQLNLYQRLGGSNQQVVAAWEQAQSASYGWLYRTQPAVRTVVDFIARNVAQLGLKLYERVSDTERERRSEHPAAETMRHPYDPTPADRWIYDFVADFLVYENAYALKFRNSDRTLTLVQIPPHMVSVLSSAKFTVEAYRIHRSDGSHFDLRADDVIHWRGYNPDDKRIGVSRLETLREVLAEEVASQKANTELMKSGLLKPGWVSRPLEAPAWSNEARKGFEQDLYNRVTRRNKMWPVLEEGMEIRDLGITPKDAEMLAGRRFTLETVARLYGLASVPPADEDERKQFYADVLPPLTEDLGCQLDHSLLRVEYGEDDFYFEFDLNEKLRGDPILRFQAITAATGAPWLTRNEARALENRPPIDDGDELVTPLNVLVGPNPKPAPNVMGPQDPTKPPQDGSYREQPKALNGKALLIERRRAAARRRDRYAKDLEDLITRFYARQQRAVDRGKAMRDFDSRRWSAELADDLEKALLRTIEAEGDIQAARLAMPPFDTRQVRNYVRKMAEGIARETNSTIAAGLVEAEPKDVFDRARANSATWAFGTAGSAMRFAQLEAAKQSPGQRTKTWVVVSENSEHPEMDGETVALGQSFSNGSDGPPADHPGCACVMEIT